MGKRQVLLRPCSKVVIRFLTVMMKHGYMGEFEVVDDHRAGKIVVNLNGRLNKCGVISPRFDIQINEIEKWTNNLLPSRQFLRGADHLWGYHGPRGGQEEAPWRKDPGILLLITSRAPLIPAVLAALWELNLICFS